MPLSVQLDVGRVGDRIVAVKVSGQLFEVFLLDAVRASDMSVPVDVGRVKEFAIVVGWVLRDYPLTDWELKRNERIVEFLCGRRVFRLADFQRHVWFEQVFMQEQRGFGGYDRQMLHYRSRYIRNFCNYLFSVLEEGGYVRRVGLDSYEVLVAPSLEFINEVARRRIYDIWSF